MKIPSNYTSPTREPIHSRKRKTSKSKFDRIASRVCVERMHEIIIEYAVGWVTRRLKAFRRVSLRRDQSWALTFYAYNSEWALESVMCS